MSLKRAWIALGGGGAAFAGVLTLLVVGTYAASGSIDQAQAQTQAALELAPGTVPASYASLIAQWGTLCSQLTPPLLAAEGMASTGSQMSGELCAWVGSIP
jgi:hypothetical protein